MAFSLVKYNEEKYASGQGRKNKVENYLLLWVEF